MNAKKLTGVLGVVAAGVLGHSLYQIIPEGKQLKGGEIVGELDGPALCPYSVKLHRHGDQQFLEGHVPLTLENEAKLQQAPSLDALIPRLAERQRKQRKQSVVAGTTSALASGHLEIASTILMGSASDETNLLYRDQGNGRYSLLGHISRGSSIGLIAPPSGNPLYLTSHTIRDLPTDELPAWDALRSDDLGATWQYDKDVTLRYQRFMTFLSSKRAIALGECDSIICLNYSNHSAKHWSIVLLPKQVWNDADEFEKAFFEQSSDSGDGLVYDWSLYPLDVDRAIGWSWRSRLLKNGEIDLIENRGFEVLLDDDAPPTFQVTRAVALLPLSSRDYIHQAEGLPTYETLDNQIYVLDKVEKNWHRLAATPRVRGAITRIGEAWFGRDAWVVLVYADPWISFIDRAQSTTYFYTRDQGKTWHPFQLPAGPNRLLGLDASGNGLLVNAERDCKTVIRRYALD